MMKSLNKSKIFPTKILHLKIFGRLFKYSSGVCYAMSGHGILKYFCPILKKVPPKDKYSYTRSVWAIIEGSLMKIIASTNRH